MDRQPMTNEENYHFDIAGFLHIPGVLNSGELQRLNDAVETSGASSEFVGLPEGQREPFRELLVHPQLVWYLNQLVGPGFKLDRLPEILGSDPAMIDQPLVGGNEPLNPGTAYFYKNGRRYCQAVRVIWALSDVEENAGGFVFVPHTHRGNVDIPEDILTGVDDLGLTRQVTMRAGDLLIIGLSVAQGVREWTHEASRLLSFEYTGRGVLRSPGTGEAVETYERPDFLEELSDVQIASIHRPDYRDSTPPPTIVTDGETATVGVRGDLFHPSIYVKNPDANIDEKEFFFWDLCGYLVVRNVMDEAWLAEANEAMDLHEDQIEIGSNTAGKSKTLAGSGRPELRGLFKLPGKHGEAFRKMIAHPPIEHRINWMGGSGAWLSGATAICSVEGTSGHTLHTNGEPLNPSRQWFYQNGRSYCQAITCTWQLRDVTEDDGGFACVPGSNHANYPLPRDVSYCDEPMGLVKHIDMKAGDVLFFADGSNAHGTYAWKGPLSRRGVLIKYSSRRFNRGGGAPSHPENRWGNAVEGMTDAQLAVMRGADRDVFANNVPRLDVENGRINVSYERGGSLYSTDTPDGPVAKKP